MARIGQLEVPAVGVGCNAFGQWTDEASALAVVDAALDAEAAFFDTADYYADGGSEELLGHALRGRRHEAVVATKFGMWGLGPKTNRADPAFVAESAVASLRRLGTDHIDLYQLHYPDPRTPIADTVGALEALVQAGTVREVGVCNVTAELVEEWAAAATPTVRLASVQNEWSLLRRGVEASVAPAALRHGIAVLPFFPLANGLLTGKYGRDRPVPEGSRFAKVGFLADRYLTNAHLEQVERLAAFAEARGRTVLELAISWLTGRPEVPTVIAGASGPDQVHANVAAAGWLLDESERAEVDALLNETAAPAPTPDRSTR